MIRVKPIARVFRSSSPEEASMRVQLARLCVLYEDLKIEFAGAEAEDLGGLDHTDATTRRFYFVRRTLGTLAEFEQAIVKLNANKEFKSAKGAMSKENLKLWDDAIKFFGKEHEFLKDWRNDLGGHFLDAAAKYALENMHPDTLGVIDLHRQGNGAGVRMKFAYELVAVAMTKNKRTTEPERDFLERAFEFLRDAYLNAYRAGQVAIGACVYPRFVG